MDSYNSSSTFGGTYGVLELCLEGILSLIKPLEDDRAKRLNIINDLATLLRSMESLKGAVVNPFGSFVSNLYTRWGDLDISIEVSRDSPFSTTRKHKQLLLRDIMRALRRTGIGLYCQFIPSARVPLLIFESKYQKISCDVSIDNGLGHIKSKVLLWMTEIDERFRDMVLLTKEWAKAQNINNPKSGTLNSFSLCLLVIFHFQTCHPAILPPLKEIYAGNIGDDITGMRFRTERNIEDICSANIASFRSQSSGGGNQSSLSQLLISFFEKFSRIGTLASEYAICTYTGQWERISTNPKWIGKPHSLLIEDPFEQPENASRAVGLRELSMISNVFMDAHKKFSSQSVLVDRNYMLANLVRPSISSQLGVIEKGAYSTNGGPGRCGTGLIGYLTDKPIRNQFQNGDTEVHHQTKAIPKHFQHALQLDGQHPASSSSITLPRQRAQTGLVGHLTHQPIPNQFKNGGTEVHHRTKASPKHFQHALRLDGQHPASSSGITLPRQGAQTGLTGHLTHQPINNQFQNGGTEVHHQTKEIPKHFQHALRLDGHHPASSSSITLRSQGAQNMQSQQMWRPRLRIKDRGSASRKQEFSSSSKWNLPGDTS